MQFHRGQSLPLPPVLADSNPMVKRNSSLIFGLGEKEWEGKLRGGEEGCAQLQNQHSLLISRWPWKVWQIKAQKPLHVVNSLPDSPL